MSQVTFDSLYQELRAPVLRLCLHVTGNRAAAEDAAQETFLAVHRGLGAFRNECKPSTWVYRIALRAALRMRSRRLTTELADKDWVVDPEGALEAREQVRKLVRAMESLSGEQRSVLSLFALDGIGHQEVAEVLGVPLGTVWSRLHSARKRLELELEGKPGCVG